MTETKNKSRVQDALSVDKTHWPEWSSESKGSLAFGNESRVQNDDNEKTEEVKESSLMEDLVDNSLSGISNDLSAQDWPQPTSLESASLESATGEVSDGFADLGLEVEADEEFQADVFLDTSNRRNDAESDIGGESLGSGERKQLDLSSVVEAVLFATSKPLKVGDILEILADETVTSKDVSEVIASLVRFYKTRQGGFRLENVRGGYQFQTVPEAGDIMEKMFSSRPRPISRAAQETLAIIAYRQPVTRADIEFIRGVDAGSIMKNLLERNLIKCVGRKEDSGRPMLFGTTDEFLSVYGLNSLGDLPPLESFQPSHEIMKNAMQSIEEGDRLDDTNDFVGNYDEQADLADELEPTEAEVFEADYPSPDMDEEEEIGALSAETPEETLEELQEESMSLQKPQRIKGASKIEKQGSETTPQGVFLGGIDGGFNDDETKEENEY